MNSETKTCQNCKHDFTIEPEDFDFYAKIDVPAPTFCPECRMQRRMMFRNERTLYKRACDFTGKSMVAIFPADSQFTVYHQKEWWGDGWDQYEHGMEYDPSRHFFDQVRELMQKTPWMNLVVDNDNVNSEYINHASACKDAYLVFNADRAENTLYSSIIASAQDTMDSMMLDRVQFCYEYIGGANASRAFFSEGCDESMNMYFSKNCIGCSDCFGCVNLRKKQYCIWNEQYTKEEYEEKIKEFQLDSYTEVQKIWKEAQRFWSEQPTRYYTGIQNIDSSGEYISNSKNAKNMYIAHNAEDCRYCSFITSTIKDSYDISEWGENLELSYDAITVGADSTEIKFSFAVWNNAYRAEYCIMSPGAKNCFGCVNTKKAEYCILNKQYSKEEYFKLRDQIIADMKARPYIDAQGREYRYGEFFPYDMSPFAYNESWAMDFFRLTQEEVTEQGFVWKEPEQNQYQTTCHAADLPDSIHDVDESILSEIIACHTCGKAYRIVAAELQLLQRFGLPLPRSCSECRHQARLKRMNQPKLYQRTTEDGVEVMTSYAPDRPEKIYSEKGYQDLIL
jgi:hypothetical protein